MILVDTSVLMHAIGEEHPLREPSRQVLTAQLHSRLDFAVTVEVLQEFCHARARRRGRDDAVANTRQFAILFRVLETTADDLEHGLEIFRAQPKLGAFDAVLAGLAIARGAAALVSADQGFSSVPNLTWVRPGSADFDRLLS